MSNENGKWKIIYFGLNKHRISAINISYNSGSFFSHPCNEMGIYMYKFAVNAPIKVNPGGGGGADWPRFLRKKS